MNIIEIGLCIFVLILIIQVYLLGRAIKTMQGEYTKINTDIVKLGLYQLEQYKLNEQVIQKIIQLEEKDFYRNIDFLKKSGKLGEA
jgi:DNA polymerase III delta prime subunit